MNYYWKFDHCVKFRQLRHKWVFCKIFQSGIILIELKENQQNQIQNPVKLASEHLEDNEIIISL